MSPLEDSMLSARVLGQLMLMQSVLSNLPDEQTIFSFVCQGLLDVPGVKEINYSKTHLESLEPGIFCIPISVGASKYGELCLKISNPPAFTLYEHYLNNFGFMVAVILEERKQRRINELNQRKLEDRIRTRTQELYAEIAERKQTETALRESQHFITSIVETTPELVYIYDLDERRNIYTNREIASVLGYSPDEIQQMGDKFFALLLHPEDFEAVIEHHQKMVFAKEDILELDYRMKDAKGEWHWLHSRDKAFSRKEDGTVKEIVGVALDITASKHAEIALKESEAQFRIMAENSTDMISRHTPEGIYLYVSPACKKLLGYTPKELLGHSAFEFIHPDDLNKIEQSRLDVSENQKTEWSPFVSAEKMAAMFG